jgi:RecA/RadA recombinase
LANYRIVEVYMSKKTNAAKAIDFDKIINRARANFINKDKGLAQQLVSGSNIPRPTKPEEFVYWPDSPWHLMTQVPGLPFGRIVQIAGKPDSGKSTHAMQFMKLAQDQDHVVILWDPENKFSVKRFENFFGGCADDLLVVTNRMISEGCDLIEAYVRAIAAEAPNKKILIVWDSVGGTLPKSENTDVTDKKSTTKRGSRQMAEAAKENGMAVRGFVALMEEFKDRDSNQERIAVLLINQTYSNIGSVGQKESGGQKVEFFSSIIIQMSRVADLTKIRNKVKYKLGITSRAKIRKNHLIDKEDTIAEIRLDITAGGIKVNAKDPAISLVTDDHKSDPDLKEENGGVEGWEEQDD